MTTAERRLFLSMAPIGTTAVMTTRGTGLCYLLRGEPVQEIVGPFGTKRQAWAHELALKGHIATRPKPRTWRK